VTEFSTRKLRELSREELEIQLRDWEEELHNLHLRASLKQEGNPLRMRYMRRAVARVKTMLLEDDRGIRALARQDKK
jgi:large subunit ribosomal protein L29